MTLWTIIPRDPLIFRDGRPFNANAGARAKSLPFPFPSTLAGAVRTAAGPNPETGKFDEQRIAELLSLQIRGPLLIELEQDGQIAEWLFPAPADALLLKHDDKKKARRLQLCPVNLRNGEKTDLSEDTTLNIVAPTEPAKEKPHSKAPHYWHKKEFEAWLQNPHNGVVTLTDIGHDGPVAESRMHVQIDPKTGTGVDGALFQTSGLEFTHREREEDEKYPRLKDTKVLSLVVETDADLSNGMGFLGGERRVAQWRQSNQPLPPCPDEVRKKISTQATCRLILLTPAYFEDGYLPTWLVEQYGVEIVGAAVPRYQTVSGWDYAINQPKPTRRLAPAGSVYFLRINKDVENFIDAVWMQTVSDDSERMSTGQNRRDGFGLAVLGTWSGDLRNMEVHS